mmetsp:Transcript_33715/g.74240  ORF Transcript_33715/g.74240 Transcript_33715/m.74240 type:complete len:965 (+) Transcript_33715:233-3127(+)
MRILAAAAALQLLALTAGVPAVSAEANTAGTDDRNLLDTSNVNPKSSLLTAEQWMNYLITEVGEEYEIDDEYATDADLVAKAEAIWLESSKFEFARAIRDGEDRVDVAGNPRPAEPYPFLLCDYAAGEDGSRQGGFVRRQRIRDAVDAASATTGIALGEDEMLLQPLYNGDNAWCGYGLLNGIVAEEVELEGIVQPLVMAMKMAKNTVSKMVDGVEEFYNEEEPADPEQRFLRMMQESGVGEDDPVMGLPEPVKETNFPSATITICPGGLTETAYNDIVGAESTDFTDAMTEWLLASTNAGEEIVQDEIKENVFWSNSNMKEQGWEPTERGKFWDDVLTLAYQDDTCTSTFRNKLRWQTRLAPVYEEVHALLVEFDTTDAEELDVYCVLGMLAGLGVNNKVCQIEITPTQTVANDHAQWLTQTAVRNEKPFFDVGLDGTGQVVALSDTGVDRDNCYFGDSSAVGSTYSTGNRKLVLYDDYVNDNDYQYGHGTHVAGSILGNREDGQGLGQGMAPGAKLAFIDIGFDNGALSLPSDDRLLGTGRNPLGQGPPAHIHSASWGVIGENGYNYQCRSFDSYMYSNDDFLILVAAGNDGRYDSRNTVSAPSTAKNVISVGASHSYADDLEGGMLGPAHVADFSSRGPTADGRVKPDLVAPGKYILSAGARPDTFGECDEGRPRPGNGKGGLTSMMGTSMATPVTAGTAALVRQYLEEGWYAGGTKGSGAAISPSGTLVKAILINGAQTDIKAVDNSAKSLGTHTTGVKPYDDAQGFGRLSLTNSVYIRGKTDVQVQFWDGETVTYNGLRRYPIKIDTSNGCTNPRLSVTLAWTDPPATVNCVRCLVNDLDLYLTKTGNATTFYPNGLDTKDSINNVERVIIEDVSHNDEFSINIDPYNLDTFNQKFALVATGCFGGVANNIDTSKNVYATDDSEDVRTRNIIIICCSVGGFLILVLAIVLCKKRKARKG